MGDDQGILDWKESRKAREQGAYCVFIKGMRPTADVDFVARMIARQKDVEIIEAISEIRSIVGNNLSSALLPIYSRPEFFA